MVGKPATTTYEVVLKPTFTRRGVFQLLERMSL
jgi:hypothetical protein